MSETLVRMPKLADTLVEGTHQGIQYQFLFFWLMGGYLGYAPVIGAAASVAALPAKQN